MFGRITHGRWGTYKGIKMRSSWEILYAKYLDKCRIKWIYEPTSFDLGDATYRPDFYLPILDSYIEIKGWWRKKGLKKFKLFKELYPKIKISVIREKSIKIIKENLNEKENSNI